MLTPLQLRNLGIAIAWIGGGAVLAWLGYKIWAVRDLWLYTSYFDALLVPRPIEWLYVILAAAPGTILYYVAEHLEAKRLGMTFREYQMRQHLHFSAAKISAATARLRSRPRRPGAPPPPRPNQTAPPSPGTTAPSAPGPDEPGQATAESETRGP